MGKREAVKGQKRKGDTEQVREDIAVPQTFGNLRLF